MVGSSRPDTPSLERIAVCCLAAALFAVGLCIVYVRSEMPLYYWDYGYYWRLFQTYGERIGGGNWLGTALWDIRSNDYSPAPIIPLYPFYHLFGGSRQSYLTGVAVLYLVPTSLIAALLARAVGVRGFALPFLLAVIYTPFWAPTLRGLPDIVGTVFLAMATLIMLRSGFLRHHAPAASVALGVVIWLPFFFRRWYAYSILCFFAVSFLMGAYRHWREGGLPGTLRFAVLLGGSGVIASLLVFAFQRDLAIRAITTDYSTLYDAYQVTAASHALIQYYRTGVFILSLIAIGAIFAPCDSRAEAWFCLLTAVLTLVLFSNTQILGAHHYLPVALWLFPLYSLGFSRIVDAFVRPARPAVAFGMLLISVAIFALGLNPRVDMPRWGYAFLGQYGFPPLTIENFEEYRRLSSDIEKVAGGGKKVAVYASSPQLSDALLTAINPAIEGALLPMLHRDREGNPPLRSLNADYAVWTDPNQTHLAQGSQMMITLANTFLRKGQGFGVAFGKVVGEYHLASGVRAVLAERTRPVTVEEISELLSAFLDAHPELRAAYEPSMIVPFAARRDTLGDAHGQVFPIGNNVLFMHPGAHEATSSTIPLFGTRPTRVDLSVLDRAATECPGADGVEATVRADGQTLLTAVVLPGSPTSLRLPDTAQSITLSVNPRAAPSCDFFNATFRF
jgi:hypothetical protein